MKRCSRCNTGFTAADWTCPACGNIPPRADGFILLAPELATAGGGFRPDAFEQLAALEAKNFWFKARNQLILRTLKRYFPDMTRYMEIGCGTGYVLAGVAGAYPEATLVGSEVFTVGLGYAASRVRKAELLQMDAREIPYDGEFDVIGAFDVLEHIDEDEVVLASMLRAVRPGGGIALTVPQHRWLWSSADDSACHVRRYTVGELSRKVQRAGFQVVFETSFVSLLLPAMLASRLTKRRPKAVAEAMPELNLPSWLNRVFEVVMNVERRLICSGLRFKFGGSRLLVATKKR